MDQRGRIVIKPPAMRKFQPLVKSKRLKVSHDRKPLGKEQTRRDDISALAEERGQSSIEMQSEASFCVQRNVATEQATDGDVSSSDKLDCDEFSPIGDAEDKVPDLRRLPERGDYLVHKMHDGVGIDDDNFVVKVTAKPTFAKGKHSFKFRSVTSCSQKYGSIDVKLDEYGEVWRFATQAEVAQAEDECDVADVDETKSRSKGKEPHTVASEEDVESLVLHRRVPERGDYLVHKMHDDVEIDEDNFVVKVTAKPKLVKGKHSFKFRSVTPCSQKNGTMQVTLDQHGEVWRFATRNEIASATNGKENLPIREMDGDSSRAAVARKDVARPRAADTPDNAKSEDAAEMKKVSGSSDWEKYELECKRILNGGEHLESFRGDRRRNAPTEVLVAEGTPFVVLQRHDQSYSVARMLDEKTCTVEWIDTGVIEESATLKRARPAKSSEARHPDLNDCSRFPPRKGDYVIYETEEKKHLARVERDCKEPEPGVSHAAVETVGGAKSNAAVFTLKTEDYGLVWRYAKNVEIVDRLLSAEAGNDRSAAACFECGATQPEIQLRCDQCRTYVICGCCNDPPLKKRPPTWYCPDCGWASESDA